MTRVTVTVVYHYGLPLPTSPWVLETGDAEKALRLSGTLWRFWQTRGYLSEGLEWLQTALNLKPMRPDSSLASARAKALLGAGWLLRDFGDFAGMKKCFEECLTICKQLEDALRLTYALCSMGYANFLVGDHVRSIQSISSRETDFLFCGESCYTGASRIIPKQRLLYERSNHCSRSRRDAVARCALRFRR